MAHTIPRFIHHPHSPLSVLLPPPTTTPSLFSNHHHHTPQGHCAHPLPTLLPHTHTWCGWHVPLWLLSRPVCGVCGWHAHPITSSSHTQPQPLWLCPSPHHHSLVCVWMEARATWPCPTTNHSLAWRGLLAFFTSACNQALCHPPCVCVVDWWLACVWCGHLCECLCVGWLCCFPPHCVSCVPPCPHPSVSPHSLALVLLLVVVIGGG